MNDHMKDRKHSAVLLIGDDAWLAGPIFLSSFKAGDNATCREIFSICMKSPWKRDFLLSEHFAVALILSSERGDKSIIEMFPHGYDPDIFDAITRPFDGIIPSRTDPSIMAGCKTGTFISECVTKKNIAMLEAIHERIPEAFEVVRFDMGHSKTLSLLDHAMSANPDLGMISRLLDYGTPMFTVQPKGEMKNITPLERLFDIAVDDGKAQEKREVAKNCIMILMNKGYSFMFPGMFGHKAGNKKWENVPVIIGFLNKASESDKADELLSFMFRNARRKIDTKDFSAVQAIIADQPKWIAKLETLLLQSKSPCPACKSDRSTI